MKPISLRTYAKHRGCSLSTVQEAIAARRITVDADGKIPDPDEADRQWETHTDERKRPLTSSAAETQPMDDYRRARTRRETALAEVAEVEARRLSGGEWMPASAFVEQADMWRAYAQHVIRELRSRLPSAIDQRCSAKSLAREVARCGAQVKHVCGQPNVIAPSAVKDIAYGIAMHEIQLAVDQVLNELAAEEPLL